DHFKRRIVHRVDDSIGTPAETMAIAVAGQPLRAVRTGIGCQPPDASDDTLTLSLRGDGLDLLGGRGLDQDLIGGHAASDVSRNGRSSRPARLGGLQMRPGPPRLPRALAERPR